MIWSNFFKQKWSGFVNISEFSRNSSFLRRKRFSWQSCFEQNSQPFWSKTHFSGSGPPKTSQELTFIKVSEPGSQKTDSGPKRHFRAPEMLKNVKSRSFLVQLWKWPGTLKMVRALCKNDRYYQRFGRAQNGAFSEIPNCLHKNQDFHRKRKMFCAICATFRVFWSCAARMRQAL